MIWRVYDRVLGPRSRFTCVASSERFVAAAARYQHLLLRIETVPLLE